MKEKQIIENEKENDNLLYRIRELEIMSLSLISFPNNKNSTKYISQLLNKY